VTEIYLDFKSENRFSLLMKKNSNNGKNLLHFACYFNGNKGKKAIFMTKCDLDPCPGFEHQLRLKLEELSLLAG
jgi:hypothetical protein